MKHAHTSTASCGHIAYYYVLLGARSARLRWRRRRLPNYAILIIPYVATKHHETSVAAGSNNHTGNCFSYNPPRVETSRHGNAARDTAIVPRNRAVVGTHNGTHGVPHYGQGCFRGERLTKGLHAGPYVRDPGTMEYICCVACHSVLTRREVNAMRCVLKKINRGGNKNVITTSLVSRCRRILAARPPN